MKIVPESFLEKFIGHANFLNIQVINIPGGDLEHFNRDPAEEERNPFKAAQIISLPYNSIIGNALETFWMTFEEGWWINLSNNKIKNLPDDKVKLPLSLGSLSLLANPIRKIEDVKVISSCHLLRLYINLDIIENTKQAFDSEWDRYLNLAAKLPLVWIINDRFIPYQDRDYISNNIFTCKSLSADEAIDSNGRQWSALKISDKQASILRAVQSWSKPSALSDCLKLDILLEDYINEIMMWNEYCLSSSRSNLSVVKVVKSVPIFTRFDAFLFLHHRQRLDLSVLLTASVMFNIPLFLLQEAMLITLDGFFPLNDVKALASAPSFVKTAIVSLLRRITLIEKDDRDGKQKLRVSELGISLPSSGSIYELPLAEYTSRIDGASFRHLRNIKRFLEFQFPPTALGERRISEIPPFSELELEILHYLPHAPVQFSGFREFPKFGSEVKYSRWVPFAARHAVFLLNKAPSCPPLTRFADSNQMQDTYLDILPLLKAANMSLVDLEIVSTGPNKDGRNLKAARYAANIGPMGPILENKSSTMSKHRKRLEMCFKLLDGKVLPFGVGLPRASSSKLHWKADDVNRPYTKPWKGLDAPTLINETKDEQKEDNQEELAENPSSASMFYLTDVVLSGKKPNTSPKVVKSLSPTAHFILDPECSRSSMNESEMQRLETDKGFQSSLVASSSNYHISSRPLSSRFRMHSPTQHELSKCSFDLGVVAPELLPPEFNPSFQGEVYDANSFPFNASRPASSKGPSSPLDSKSSVEKQVAFAPDVDSFAKDEKSQLSVSLPSVQLPGQPSNAESIKTPFSALPKFDLSRSDISIDDSLDDDDEVSLVLMDGRFPDSSVERTDTHELLIQQPASSSHAAAAGSSSRGPHVVNVFSADLKWEPGFVLAPVEAVESFNSHYQQFMNAQSQSNELGQSKGYWKKIEHSPVVLLGGSNSTHTDQLSSRNLKMSNTSCFSPCKQLEPVRETLHHEIAGVSALDSFDGSATDRSRFNSAHLSASHSSYVHDNAMKESIISKTDDEEDVFQQLKDGSIMNQNQSDRTADSYYQRVETVPADSYNNMSYEDAANQLLLDMGTIRNTRELQNFNKALYSLKLSKDGRAIQVTSKQRESEPSGMKSDSQRVETDISLLWRGRFLSQPTKDYEDQGFFVTEPPQLIENNDDNDNEALHEQEQEQYPGEEEKKEFVAASVEYLRTFRPQIETHGVHDKVASLREQLQYPDVYSMEQYIDRDAIALSASGAKVGGTFYPVFPKVVYKLPDNDKSQITATADSSSTAKITANKRVAQPVKLYQNRALSLIHDDPSRNMSAKPRDSAARGKDLKPRQALSAAESNLSLLKHSKLIQRVIRSQEQDMMGKSEELTTSASVLDSITAGSAITDNDSASNFSIPKQLRDPVQKNELRRNSPTGRSSTAEIVGRLRKEVSISALPPPDAVSMTNSDIDNLFPMEVVGETSPSFHLRASNTIDLGSHKSDLSAGGSERDSLRFYGAYVVKTGSVESVASHPSLPPIVQISHKNTSAHSKVRGKTEATRPIDDNSFIDPASQLRRSDMKVSKSLDKLDLRPEGRLRAVSATNSQFCKASSWVGYQQYKAASKRLSLNRSFRVSSPGNRLRDTQTPESLEVKQALH